MNTFLIADTYPWARSPQLISAVSEIALSSSLTILRLLELLTEHLGGLVLCAEDPDIFGEAAHRFVHGIGFRLGAQLMLTVSKCAPLPVWAT